MTFARTSVPALFVAGALLVAACGSTSPGDNRPTAAGNPVDRAFAAQMIDHHRSAVQMAKIAQRRGTSAFVQQLAADIVRSQSEQIATLRAADRRLRRAGVKKGSLGVPQHMMGMNADMSMLTRTRALDRAFLHMMIPHHAGAVVMADAELRKGKDLALTRLAQTIITAQEREIRQMRKHLGHAGAAGMRRGSMHGAERSG
jgi:uncharacterized protein (DUF305 family)